MKDSNYNLFSDDDELTVFTDEQKDTCKTCDTCVLVTNEQFLAALFHTKPDGAQSAMVSFAGNPHTVHKGKWFAQPYQGQEISRHNNNYTTVSSYQLNEAGEFRRTKNTFAALHGIMLDDLGTKIPLDRVNLPFSWLIKTSEGNYQGGYILNAPLTDAATADSLMDAVIDAGLCDTGAGGVTARLGRLPQGVNGKKDPVFHCELVEWSPDRRYTVEQITQGLGLVLREKTRTTKTKANPSKTQAVHDDSVYIPRPESNPVIVALQQRGLYKSPLGDGKHDITCPWVHEHTGGIDGGTAYFEPDETFPIGGFKCQHSHGDRLHIRQFLEFLAIELSAARMKPTIRTSAGAIHSIVDTAEQLLAATGHCYQSGGVIATIRTDADTNETSIYPITQPALLRKLSRIADWQRYDQRSEDWATTDPTAKYVTVLYDAGDYPHLPTLRGIARQPHLRIDGSLVKLAGYDRETGLFGVFDARLYNVPDNPTKADALAALQVLLELVEEVAFDDANDLSAAVCAMLTAAIRQALPTAPAFLVTAHLYGSGKSFLVTLLCILATPHKVAGMAFPTDADEMRKTLISELIKSPPVINFDDMSGDVIPSDALKTTLTESYIAGRLLGVSKTVTCSTRSLILASGNNIQPIRDMARRVLTIKLDPKLEIPTTRTFKRPNIENEARRDRARYVSAALTIIRAFIVAGQPKKENVKTIASYGQWSDWCRQPLLWLGLADPASRLFEQLDHDPDRELLGRVMEVWRNCYGDMGKLLRDAIADANQELRDVLMDIAAERGEINSRLLGWWFKKHEGRIVDGFKITKVDSSRGSVKWRVAQVVQVSQVFSRPSEKTVSDNEDF